MIATIEDDFDLERIAQSGQCFRWSRVGDGTYRIIQRAACIYAADLGDRRFHFECDEDAFEDVWRDYFDLGEDYRRIRDRIDAATDPFLWHASEQEKGIRILRQDAWEMLVSFIISQNRNIPAIQRSIGLLSEAAGERCEDSRGRTYYAFPSAQAVAALSDAELGRCALGYRQKYVSAAAHAVLAGDINLDQLRNTSPQQTIDALMRLYGVGAKVASCVALFGLHQLDAFPVDVWVKRVLENEYPDGYPFERYRPYNGVYQQYLFAAYRNAAYAKDE